MPGYNSVAVTFEHCTTDSDSRRINRLVLTVYGDSEFAVLAELQRQNPSYVDIVILQCDFR